MCQGHSLRTKKDSKAKRINQIRVRARVSRYTEPEQTQTQRQPEPSTSPSSTSQSSESAPSPFPPHLNIPEAKAFAAVMECVEPGVYRYKRDALPHLSPEIKARNERLVEIALKTVILIRRNQQLQRKLAALQVETSSFITNVRNNPENRHGSQDDNDPDSPISDVRREFL